MTPVSGHVASFKAFSEVSSLLVSAIGLLCLWPECGWMTIVTSDGLGGRMARRLLPAGVLVPVALQMVTLALQHQGLLDNDPGAAIDAMAAVTVFVVLIVVTARLIDRLDEERRSREADLRASETKYRRFIDIAFEGIVVLDETARVVMVNPRMAEMSGYTAEELSGRSAFSLLDAPNQALFAQAMERRKRGDRERYELALVDKNGHQLHVRISSAPILDEQGCVWGSEGRPRRLIAAVMLTCSSGRRAETANPSYSRRSRCSAWDSTDRAQSLQRGVRREVGDRDQRSGRGQATMTACSSSSSRATETRQMRLAWMEAPPKLLSWLLFRCTP